MSKTKVPCVKVKRQKRYQIVTKPTTHAFCQGRHVEQKIVSEEWLQAALLAAKHDPDIERYFYEEVKGA